MLEITQQTVPQSSHFLGFEHFEVITFNQLTRGNVQPIAASIFYPEQYHSDVILKWVQEAFCLVITDSQVLKNVLTANAWRSPV